MPIDLKGTKAPDPANRTVTTAAAEVKFEQDVAGQKMPGLIVNKRQAQDAAPSPLVLQESDLAAIDTVDKLEARAKELVTANQAYLEATDVEGKNARLGTAGLRKPKFMGALREALKKTKIPEADRAKADKLLARMEGSLFLDRNAELDVATLNSYHPYSDPYSGGVKALAELAPAGAARESIEAVLNFVADHKTAKGGSSIDERNGERTLGLRVVDRTNGGQAVSLAATSKDLRSPEYVILNVAAKAKLPADVPDRDQVAGKAVYRAGDKLYFDKTNTEVPAKLLPFIEEKRAGRNLGLRLLEPGEILRDKFPYDWNRSGSIDIDKIDIGWWGHCHIKSQLGTLDLKAGSEVTIFDAKSGVEKTFKSSDVNDLLFALFDTDGYSSYGVERTRFVGNRNDTTGSPIPSEELTFQLEGGGAETYRVALTKAYDAAGNEVSHPEIPFLPTKLDKPDGLSFSANPEFVGLSDQDWSTVKGERKLGLKVSYYDMNSEGEIFRRTQEVTLDPKATTGERITLDATIGWGDPPNTTRVLYNPATHGIETQTFAAKKGDDELNLEVRMKLRAVDRDNGNQSISLAPGSTDPAAPKYEVLNIKADGLPPILAAHAGMAVTRSGDKLYFDKSGNEVPAALAAFVVAKPASENLGVRLLGKGESPRADFPFDVNGDKKIAAGTFETDIERLLNMRLVDAKTGRVVSLAEGSQSDKPSYALLNVPAADKLPDEYKALAGKPVYKSGWSYQIEGSTEEVPWEVSRLLVSTPAGSDLTFRPLKEGESPRSDVPFDLNGDGAIGNGTYVTVPTGPAQARGKVVDAQFRRELTMESVLEIHNELKRAIREGISFVADTSEGQAVWNYGVTGVRMSEVAREGNFVKYAVSMQGASKSWEYIIREDDDGNPVEAHPLSPPPDFLWQPERAVALPQFQDPATGTVSSNTAARDRGYIKVTGRGEIDQTSLGFYRYAADVIYASLADPKKGTRQVIRDDKGNLYFYEDAEAFAKDKGKLEAEAKKKPPTTVPGHGPR